MNKLNMLPDSNEEQNKTDTDFLGFSCEQLIEISLGTEQGLDVSIYAKSEFWWTQMKQIRLGLEAGLDVSMYARPKFDWGGANRNYQMWSRKE